MARVDAYIAAYSQKVRAAKQFEQFQEVEASADERQEFREKLVADAVNALKDFEETLRVRVSPFDTAAKLVSDEFTRAALASQGLSAAKQLPRSLETPKTLTAFQTALQGTKGGLTVEQKELARKKGLELIQDLRLNATELATATEALNNRIALIETIATPSGKPAEGVSPQLLDLLSRQGETGYKGGEKGQAYRESLSTEENRDLNEYLEILGRGEQPPEGHPGAPIYSDVARMGAFQIMDAKLFNPTWIALRQRVTTLQNKAESLDPELRRQGRTPYEQAAYNTLKARGVDPDDPMRQLRGTPAYEAMKLVDTLPRSRDGYPLRGSGPAYSAAQKYIEVIRKSGGLVDIPDLIEQVKKVSGSEKEAIQASAWAMATDIQDQRLAQGARPQAAAAVKKESEGQQKEITNQLSDAEKQAKVEDLKARSAATAESMKKMLEERKAAPAPGPAPAPAARPETMAPLKALDAALAGRAPPPAPSSALPARPTPPPARPAPVQSPAPRAPAPAPSAPPVPAPAPAVPQAPVASEADQLKALLKSGAIKRGTPQYDAALERLDVLEGVR